jgi:hypothetical protein
VRRPPLDCLHCSSPHITVEPGVAIPTAMEETLPSPIVAAWVVGCLDCEWVWRDTKAT